MDLINRQDAIRLAEQGQIQGYPWQFEQLVKLPSAQLDHSLHTTCTAESDQADIKSDCISRQDAIDAIIADKVEDGLPVITDTQERDFEVFNSLCDRHAKILKELPSAKPSADKCWGCNCPKMRGEEE